MISAWLDGDSSVLPGVGFALTWPLFARPPSEELIMVIFLIPIPHLPSSRCRWSYPLTTGEWVARLALVGFYTHLPLRDPQLFRPTGRRHDAVVGPDLLMPLF